MEKSSIGIILDLLRVDKFYNCSENVDIAKGKYSLPLNWKQMKNVIKRNKHYNND